MGFNYLNPQTTPEHVTTTNVTGEGMIVSSESSSSTGTSSTTSEVSKSLGLLRTAAESKNLLVGAAASADPSDFPVGGWRGEPEYANVLSREFNYLTPEDAMKWGYISSHAYGNADYLVSFALNNKMKVKGHNLIWGQSLPTWINDQMSSDDLRKAMQDHIHNEVSHFKGEVLAWDVVNEAMEWNGALKQNVFLSKLGSGYIADAFRLAHEADPDALLILNENGAEGMNRKSNMVYDLVKKLLADHVPIGGVGLQTHISATDYPSPSEITANVQRLTGLGLKVNISEMDVRIHDAPGTMNDKLELQRRVYHDVIAACVKVKEFMGVTFWGFTDAHSWITSGYSDWDINDAPLLFDMNYNPKPAYWGVLSAVSGN